MAHQSSCRVARGWNDYLMLLWPVLISSGTATWYRVPAAGLASGSKLSAEALSRYEKVATQRIKSARDAVYTVQVSDIGSHIACCVHPEMQEAVVASSPEPVVRAKPGLQSVEIGLRPHQHTLKCDRSERVCDAVGKFREGERIFMKAHLQGVDATATKVTYKWLRSVPLMTRPKIGGIDKLKLEKPAEKDQTRKRAPSLLVEAYTNTAGPRRMMRIPHPQSHAKQPKVLVRLCVMILRLKTRMR